MRFVLLVKATPASEAGVMPPPELFEAMGRFNEELVKAGVLLAGEGFHPSSRGARVRFAGDARTVVRGPFPEVGSLVSGFWLLECNSEEEAIEWARRSPNPGVEGGTAEIEVRRIFEAADFGEAFPQELRAQEDRLRAQVEARS